MYIHMHIKVISFDFLCKYVHSIFYTMIIICVINLHSKCCVSLANGNKTELIGKPLQQVGAKGVVCLLF